MKTYGTLEIKKGEKTGEKIYINGFEPILYIGRLISDKYSPEKGQLRVDANIHNAKLIDMVMSKFPLEIIDKEKWKDLLKNLDKSEAIGRKIQKLEFVEPDQSSFIGELRPFQKLGLDFLNKTNGNSLLADEMGLGKTVQTLAFLSTKGDAFPVVVVSPLVTLRNWESEIKKFLQIKAKQGLFTGIFSEPSIKVIRSGKQRPLMYADFYIINYELLNKRVDDLIKIQPKTLVMDEVQNLRSITTVKFSAVSELSQCPSVNYRLGLSGTPIYNRGSEIWGIVDILRKGLLGSWNDFKATYCYSYAYGGKFQVTDDGQKILSKVLRDTIMLRRMKKDVLDDLPDKIRYQQVIQIDRKYYEEELQKIFANVRKAKDELNSITDDKIRKTKIMELNSESRKSMQQERQIAGISKAPYIVEYIKELLEQTDEDKFVIFVHHHKVHEIIMKGLWQFDPLQIIGTQNDKQRFKAINDFQNNSYNRVIVCGIRAGNVGVNLTAGSYVIFGELDWSPAVHKQAEDRLHRIGQKKTVIAHYLIGEDTMDERIKTILTDKALEIDSVMGDEKEEMDNQKAVDVIETLLSKFDSQSKLSQLISDEEV